MEPVRERQAAGIPSALFELDVSMDVFAQVGEPLLEEAYQFFYVPYVGPYSERHHAGENEPRGSRGAVRWGEAATWNAMTKFVATAVGFMADRPDALEGGETAIQELLGTYIKGQLSTEQLVFLPVRVLAATERIQKLREISERVSQAVNGIQEPRQQFELMKVLAEKRPSKKDFDSNKRDQHVESLQVMYTFAGIDRQVTDGLPVGEMLEDGKFDTFIAKDLLREVAEQERDELTNGMLELRRELELISRAVDPDSFDLETVISNLSSSEARQQWPEAGRRELQARVQQYAQGLQKNQTFHTEFFETYDCIVSASTEQDMHLAANELGYEIAKQRSTNTKLARLERVAAHGILNERKRNRGGLRRSAQQLGETAVGAQQGATGEAAKLPRRQLVFILPSGRNAVEGSDECEAAFREYLADNQGQPGIEEDLMTVREYLKDLDMSHGKHAGVRKLPTSNVKRGTTTLNKVYALTPSETPDLHPQSAAASKLVVLFTLSKDTVGVIAVADRSKISRIRNSLGLRGRRKS